MPHFTNALELSSPPSCADQAHPPRTYVRLPLHADNAFLGLLSLDFGDAYAPDHHKARALRTVADALGALIRRSLQAEEARKRAEIQRVLNEIIHISVMQVSLAQQLDQILEKILSVGWLALNVQGSIFLVDDEDPGVLVMVAQRGLNAHLLKACARVPYGGCLCGRAAASRAIVFASCLDERHEVRYAGISDHGHYCLPILHDGVVLGVLNMYVAHGYQRSAQEEEFLVAVTATLSGIIARRRAEEAVAQQANHDGVTGLANRSLFQAQLKQAIAHARRYRHALCVMFLDLDGFKAVNDACGHDVGDALLRVVGQRIKSCVRECDTVARIGGDEFTVICSRMNSEHEATLVAQRILDQFTRPIEVDGHTCHVGVSIGLAVYPEDGEDGNVLMQRADAAMYAVKRTGKNGFTRASEGTKSGPA